MDKLCVLVFCCQVLWEKYENYHIIKSLIFAINKEGY